MALFSLGPGAGTTTHLDLKDPESPRGPEGFRTL